MSRIPAKEIERKRDEPTGRDLVFVLPTNQTCDGKEVCCFAPGAMRFTPRRRRPHPPRYLSDYYDPEAVLHLCAKIRWRISGARRHPRKTHRRQECATVFSIDAIAQPIVARSAREGLASSGTTPGAPPSAPGSVRTASRFVERTTVDFCLVTRPPDSCGDPAAISAPR